MCILLKLFMVPALLVAMLAGASAFEVPPLRGRVSDTDGLLSASKVIALENALRTLEEKTTAQIAILTVPDLQGEDIKSFSMKVVEAWKLGQKGKDNGLLILCSEKGLHCRLEVGYGLEGAIPDGKAGDILRHQIRGKANPKKGTHDFDGAFTDAVSTISQIIYDEYAKDPTGASMRGAGPEALIGAFGLIVAFVVLGFVGAIFGVLVGGIAGGALGAGIAFWGAWSILGIFVMTVVGFLFGCLAAIIMSGVGSGGSFSDSSWSGGSSWGGGDSDGFSGGGGSFGGGGAND